MKNGYVQRLKYVFGFLLFALVVFSFFRLGFLTWHWDYFSDLTTPQIALAMLHGVRFDLSIVSFLYLPLILIALFPLKLFSKSHFFKGFSWLFFLVIVALVFILISDLIYFGEVKKHIGNELLNAAKDISFFVTLLVTQYLLPAFLLVGSVLFLAVIWNKRLKNYKDDTSVTWASWLYYVATLFIFIVFVRGGVTDKPISTINAYVISSDKFANLVLNGAYVAIRSSMGVKYTPRRPIAEGTINQYKQQMGSNNPSYPFSKRYSGLDAQKPNIVIVLLESWSFKYIDALSGSDYGVTPNFDQLIDQSLSFTEFYASGQRSINGIQAVLTGIPTLPGLPVIGSGLASNNISKLGTIANDSGYSTSFIQTSNRASFRMDAISSSLGFERYFGKEDMPALLDYDNYDDSYFGWDYEGFMKLFDEINSDAEQGKPFLSFLFTGTTHKPFAIVPEQFNRYKHNKMGENGYLNTLAYSDWSLGQFMKKAKETSWFENTIFLFSADHTLNASARDGFKEYFRVPFVIYSPKYFPEKKQISKTTSQLNILATVVDLIGYKKTFSSFGHSVFKDYKNHALVSRGSSIGLISKDQYLSHSLLSVIDSNIKGDKLKLLEDRLLVSDKLVFDAISNNRWKQ